MIECCLIRYKAIRRYEIGFSFNGICNSCLTLKQTSNFHLLTHFKSMLLGPYPRDEKFFLARIFSSIHSG